MSLLKVLTEKPEDLLLPNALIHKEALAELKLAFDKVSHNYTPLDSIHVDGLKADQVWVQAQMILEGVASKLNDKLSIVVSSESKKEDLSSEAEKDDVPSGEENEAREDEQVSQTVPKLDTSLSNDMDLNDQHSMHDVFEQSGDEDINEPNDMDEVERDDESFTSEEHNNQLELGSAMDNFDLKEFQQHVLQLEQEPEDNDGEEVDYFANIDDPSDDADLHYAEFFGPAPKKLKSQKKKVKFTEAKEDEADNESELDAIMENTKKDLFDGDEDNEMSSDSAEGYKMSKFERQQLELSQQIEELENENVGLKEWGMKGEAQAKDRPQESLFTIQFERNAKPVPVITTESTASIEDLIRERIRKQQFDDIPKRSEAAQPPARGELAELSDSKSQKSLAELYEEDHMHKENPDFYAQQSSAALETAHREVIDLFNSVSRRLDALSSWQFTPREPTPSLNIITDRPSISMEEAQPGIMAPEAQLAPQEIFKGGPSNAMDNVEMSASLKRKKRRTKAKARQSGRSTAATKPVSSRGDKKEEMFNTLKRGNVTMVDKCGSKRDMRGQEINSGASTSAANVKL